jgi:N-acetylglutamate synthase-like GNAT family acetyltransferase
MKIRPYSEKDRQACLDILHENTPEFFIAEDHDSLDEFLSHPPGPYFVGEEQGRIVACGGWALDNEEVAALTWGMVRRGLHRRGLGRLLLRFRLDEIRKYSRAGMARLHTVQLVQGFFAKEGFTEIATVPNGFGPGLDRVTMELRLRAAVEQADKPDGPAAGTS